jgi:hydrogenase expression/formation protein HypC
MCLAIPAKVIKMKGVIGEVEIGGVIREAGFQLLEKVKLGDYVLLHAGFAIQKLDQEEARQTLSLLEEIGQ